MPGFTVACSAILFDLDGVLVDSHAAIERVLRAWAADHGLDPELVLAESQGRRDLDLVAVVAPHLDPAAEVAELVAREAADVAGVRAVPGAAELLAALPPSGAWTIVTSGVREVATARLREAGLPVPAVFVTADDVVHGKPDPEGYLRGAEILGVPPGDCLVVEDAEAGLRAAERAGMRGVGVGGSLVGSRVPREGHVDDLRALAVDVASTGAIRVTTR